MKWLKWIVDIENIAQNENARLPPCPVHVWIAGTPDLIVWPFLYLGFVKLTNYVIYMYMCSMLFHGPNMTL